MEATVSLRAILYHIPYCNIRIVCARVLNIFIMSYTLYRIQWHQRKLYVDNKRIEMQTHSVIVT